MIFNDGKLYNKPESLTYKRSFLFRKEEATTYVHKTWRHFLAFGIIGVTINDVHTRDIVPTFPPRKMVSCRQICDVVLTAFFEYDTAKIVHIKSKKVGLINRLIQLAIIVYIIG